MSLHQPEAVTCPKCGHEQTVTVWQTLNAQLDPAAAADLMAGKINVFHCEKCDLVAGFNTPFVYHDMRLQLYVQFVPWELVKQESTWLDSFDERGEYRLITTETPSAIAEMLKQQMPDYMRRQHVVFEMQELVQYIIFRQVLARRHGADSLEIPDA